MTRFAGLPYSCPDYHDGMNAQDYAAFDVTPTAPNFGA